MSWIYLMKALVAILVTFRKVSDTDNDGKKNDAMYDPSPVEMGASLFS